MFVRLEIKELDSLLVRKTLVLGNEGQRYVTHCVKLITHQKPIEGIQVWI